MPQVKDLKLVIPRHYTFMVSDDFFVVFSVPCNHLTKIKGTKSTLHPGPYKSYSSTGATRKLTEIER